MPQLPDRSVHPHFRLPLKAAALSVAPYPVQKPYKTHRLSVSKRHTIYVAEYGNPNGQPVVYLHGGPGGGSSPRRTQDFDPRFYRIILFDQRGCGQSTPKLELRGNTTQNLIADMEKIRRHLKIDRWAVTGYSWGSTLALAYAQAHPERTQAVTVGGLYLADRAAIRWLYQGGASEVFADLWARCLQVLDRTDRKPAKILYAFFERLTSRKRFEREAAVRAWNGWESAVMRAKPDHVAFIEQEKAAVDADAEALSLIECYYALKNYFLKPNQLLKNAARMRDIPVWLVQGRNDWVCPFANAWKLHERLRQSQLVEVEESGHGDAALKAAFLLATEAMKRELAAKT